MLKEAASAAYRGYCNSDYSLETEEFAKKAKRGFLLDIEDYCNECEVIGVDPCTADVCCDGLRFRVKSGVHGELEMYLIKECKLCYEQVSRFVTYSGAPHKLRKIGTILENPKMFFKHKCSKDSGVEFVE